MTELVEMISNLSLEEEIRAKTLREYDILHTPQEENFNRIVRLAAQALRVPISLVSLADTNRMWFKACLGVADNETSREVAFCDYALKLENTLVVEDASEDPRFASNPLVTGEFHIRFYAGAQLRNSEGIVLGTLCVLGHQPKRPSDGEIRALEDLAKGVIAEMELRRTTKRLQIEIEEQKRLAEKLQRSRSRLEDFLAASSDLLWETDENLVIMDGGGEVSGIVFDSIRGLALQDGGRGNPSALHAVHQILERAQKREAFRGIEYSRDLGDGRFAWLEVNGKPFFDEVGSFQGYRGTVHDITRRKLAEEQNRKWAQEDPLTGLANRRVFQAKLEHTFSAAKDSDAQSALLLLDIDHFKQVNDTRGHDIGDLLVKAIASRIGDQIGDQDLLARIGGDEMAVIMPYATEEDVISIGNRIIDTMKVPFKLSNEELHSSLSIGSALITRDTLDFSSILREADLALYQSKRKGRACFSLYSQENDPA